MMGTPDCGRPDQGPMSDRPAARVSFSVITFFPVQHVGDVILIRFWRRASRLANVLGRRDDGRSTVPTARTAARDIGAVPSVFALNSSMDLPSIIARAAR